MVQKDKNKLEIKVRINTNKEQGLTAAVKVPLVLRVAQANDSVVGAAPTAGPRPQRGRGA